MNRLFTSLSTKEKTLFAKRLSFLIKAGVPILDSLHMLKKQTRSRAKTRILEHVIKDVENGQYLASSLGKFRHVFGDFAINIIKVGETGGILDQNLNYLAEELKKKHELKRKVVGSLIYPVFIMAATLAITILLMVFVFPKILPIFKSLDVTLPITTRILIFTSDFLLKYGLYLLGGVVALIIILFVLIKKASVAKLVAHRVILVVPVLGRMVQSYNMTNFCRTLGLLLKSGVRVIEAITITADTTENAAYRKQYHHLAEGVTKGKKISTQLEKNNRLFPDMLPQMVAVGETTGNLSDTLLYLSEMYEGEVEEMTKNLSNAIEPILMIFMGTIVGFLAISIITPIYEITKSLSR